MATPTAVYTPTQYVQVQNVQDAIQLLLQDSVLIANPAILSALQTSYTNMTTIATIVATTVTSN